jgi:hypothetical protein
MTIVDLTGKAVTEIRDFPAVAAITPRVRGGELAPGDGPPAIVIVRLAVDYNPGGTTRRMRIQAPMFAANCFGADRRQAAQLADAVVEAIDLRGPRRDVQNRLVYLSLVEGGGDVVLDPVTRWPTATVTFSFIGAQQAVPA